MWSRILATPPRVIREVLDMDKPSLCVHKDIIDKNVKVCCKCGRKIIEYPDGSKLFYLANGVHYFTKKGDKKDDRGK